MGNPQIKQTPTLESLWFDTASFSTRGKQSITYADLDLARCRRLLDTAKNDLISGLKSKAKDSLTAQQVLNYYTVATLAELPLSYAGISEFLLTLHEIANKYGHDFNLSVTDVLSYEN